MCGNNYYLTLPPKKCKNIFLKEYLNWRRENDIKESEEIKQNKKQGKATELRRKTSDTINI